VIPRTHIPLCPAAHHPANITTGRKRTKWNESAKETIDRAEEIANMTMISNISAEGPTHRSRIWSVYISERRSVLDEISWKKALRIRESGVI
jgi:hypothetical protein